MKLNKTTQLVKCRCQHAQQDEMYGKGVRLANTCEKQKTGNNQPAVRCTVCGFMHPRKD